jgi:hypothetical protein
VIAHSFSEVWLTVFSAISDIKRVTLIENVVVSIQALAVTKQVQADRIDRRDGLNPLASPLENDNRAVTKSEPSFNGVKQLLL